MIAFALAVCQLLDAFRPATDQFWLETLAYGGIESLSSQYVTVQIDVPGPVSGNTIKPTSDAVQIASEASLPREIEVERRL